MINFVWVRVPPGVQILYAPVAQLYSSNCLLSSRSWVRVPPGVLFGHVKRNCMTALEYGSSLERVAGWNPAVVTICAYNSIGLEFSSTKRGVVGSNPTTSTLMNIKINYFDLKYYF